MSKFCIDEFVLKCLVLKLPRYDSEELGYNSEEIGNCGFNSYRIYNDSSMRLAINYRCDIATRTRRK